MDRRTKLALYWIAIALVTVFGSRWYADNL